jgi:hypothetical protein
LLSEVSRFVEIFYTFAPLKTNKVEQGNTHCALHPLCASVLQLIAGCERAFSQFCCIRTWGRPIPGVRHFFMSSLKPCEARFVARELYNNINNNIKEL